MTKHRKLPASPVRASGPCERSARCDRSAVVACADWVFAAWVRG